MRTGASLDSVKVRLKALLAKISQHQRAVDDAARDHGDAVHTRDYVSEWEAFVKKVKALDEDANSWTSITSSAAVDNAEIEFGIFLTKFATLSAKLSVSKSTEKVKALEAILSKTPDALKAYKEEAKVDLKTDATRIVAPPWAPPSGPPPEGGSALKWAGAGAGLLGLLLVLRRLFGA